MTSTVEDIAKKIAFLNCTQLDRPCYKCRINTINRLNKTNLEILHVIALDTEPDTRLERMTPLTWKHALSLTEKIIKVIK